MDADPWLIASPIRILDATAPGYVVQDTPLTMGRWQRAWRIWERSLRTETLHLSNDWILWGDRQRCSLRLLYRSFATYTLVSVRRECSQLLGVPRDGDALFASMLVFGGASQLAAQHQGSTEGSNEPCEGGGSRTAETLPFQALCKVLSYLAESWYDVVVSIHAPLERLRHRADLLPHYLPAFGEEGPVRMTPHWKSRLAWQSRPSGYTCLLMWGSATMEGFLPPNMHWAEAAQALHERQPPLLRILSGLSSCKTLPPQSLLTPGRPFLHGSGLALSLGRARANMHTALDHCWAALSRARYRWAYHCSAALPDLRTPTTATLVVRDDPAGRPAHELVRLMDNALPNLGIYHNRAGTAIYMCVDREDFRARRALAACSLGCLLAVLQQRALPNYWFGPRRYFSHHGSKHLALEGRLRIWAVDTRADINMLVQVDTLYGR